MSIFRIGTLFVLWTMVILTGRTTGFGSVFDSWSENRTEVGPLKKTSRSVKRWIRRTFSYRSIYNPRPPYQAYNYGYTPTLWRRIPNDCETVVLPEQFAVPEVESGSSGERPRFPEKQQLQPAKENENLSPPAPNEGANFRPTEESYLKKIGKLSAWNLTPNSSASVAQEIPSGSQVDMAKYPFILKRSGLQAPGIHIKPYAVLENRIEELSPQELPAIQPHAR